MEKQVILTSAIRFTTVQDVESYKALSLEALPRNDMEFNEVTRILVGYEHIVLFGRNGRRLAALKRKDYLGMAIDGKPVVIAGDGFEPFIENEAAQVDYSGIHHPDDKGETCEACNLDQYVEQ